MEEVLRGRRGGQGMRACFVGSCAWIPRLYFFLFFSSFVRVVALFREVMRYLALLRFVVRCTICYHCTCFVLFLSRTA